MKLSVSMYSCVLAVRALGKLDLMGFIDYAATQAVAGLELLDIFWTDAEREITAGQSADRRCRAGSRRVFHQQ